MTNPKPTPVTVTLSAATKAYLTAKAAAGFRSLNRELAMRIEESCARELASPQHASQEVPHTGPLGVAEPHATA